MNKKIKLEIKYEMNVLISKLQMYGDLSVHEVLVTRDKMLEILEQFEVPEKKVDKYDWHDIMKNPKDLPEEEQEILVCLDGRAGRITYDHAIDMVYWVNDGKFYDSKIKNSMVVAWKKIEQFEEKYE